MKAMKQRIEGKLDEVLTKLRQISVSVDPTRRAAPLLNLLHSAHLLLTRARRLISLRSIRRVALFEDIEMIAAFVRWEKERLKEQNRGFNGSAPK